MEGRLGYPALKVRSIGAASRAAKGHPGSTLALVDNPNERQRHVPGRCTGFGVSLVDAP